MREMKPRFTGVRWPALRVPAMTLALGLILAGSGRAMTLEALAADPSRWPAEVVVTKAARATVIKNGVPGGMMLLGVGRKLAVTGIGPEGVTGRFGADTVRVAADQTDLFQRLGVGAPAAPAAPPTTPAPAAERLAIPTGKPGQPTRMQRHLAGRLVRLEGGSLKAVDAATLDGVKYYALYFSASWCGPCRQFTPQLARAYRELKARHPEFETVFLSADRSAGAMRDYMRDDKMPWLAVKYDERTQELMGYSGPGIPCLVLVAADGRVLSDSYEGDAYVGPGKVLRDTERILQRGL